MRMRIKRVRHKAIFVLAFCAMSGCHLLSTPVSQTPGNNSDDAPPVPTSAEQNASIEKPTPTLDSKRNADAGQEPKIDTSLALIKPNPAQVMRSSPFALRHEGNIVAGGKLIEPDSGRVLQQITNCPFARANNTVPTTFTCDGDSLTQGLVDANGQSRGASDNQRNLAPLTDGSGWQWNGVNIPYKGNAKLLDVDPLPQGWVLVTDQGVLQLDPDGSETTLLHWEKGLKVEARIFRLPEGWVVYAWHPFADSGVDVVLLGKWRTSVHELGVGHSEYNHVAYVQPRTDASLLVVSQGDSGTIVEQLEQETGKTLRCIEYLDH